MDDVECQTIGEDAVEKHDPRVPRVQFYLAKDILQGEQAPFFLLWDRPGMKSITVSFDGFDSILSLHNVVHPEEILKTCLVRPNDLKSRGYLGGVLTTIVTNEPFRDAFLELQIDFGDGVPIKLRENRILYTSRAEVSRMPANIKLDGNGLPDHNIEIDVKGCATVFIETEETKDSAIGLVMPADVATAFERFFASVNEGLCMMKERFPDSEDLIERLLKGPDDTAKSSIGQYFDSVLPEFEHILKRDKEFREAYATVLLTALFDQGSMKDSVIVPLLEYLESNAASKVFLRTPFLVLDIPAGGGIFSCKVFTFNLLNKECGVPALIKTNIESDEARKIAVKELLKFRRMQ